MCSMYWTLKTTVTCPFCGHQDTEGLQTHFAGEIGSCMNFYALGEPVAELRNIPDGSLKSYGESFISDCLKCGEFFELDAEIKGGAIVRVWPMPVQLPAL